MLRAEVSLDGRYTYRVTWLLEGADYSCPIKVTVFRADAFSGPYTEIAGPIEDRNFLVDPQPTRPLPPWYRLRVDYGNNTIWHPETGGFTFGPDLNPVMVRTAAHMAWQLLLAGRKILYYPQRTAGPYCACYNSVKGQWDKRCLNCFGSRYQGGFFNPLVIPAAGTGLALVDAESRTQRGGRRFFVPYLPSARPGDVLVERENTRWAVLHVVSKQWRGVTLRQHLDVTEVPADSILYELPVDWSLLGADERLLQVS